MEGKGAKPERDPSGGPPGIPAQVHTDLHSGPESPVLISVPGMGVEGLPGCPKMPLTAAAAPSLLFPRKHPDGGSLFAPSEKEFVSSVVGPHHLLQHQHSPESVWLHPVP